jgi:hypothetical protein
MNIPTNILKSNQFPPERIKHHQKLAKRYHRQVSKLKQNSPKNETSTTTNLKEDILNWFFSLDVITKLIMSSIENKWLTGILHQLFQQQKTNHRLRFQIREDSTPTEIYPQLIPVQVISRDLTEPTYFNYFFSKEDYRGNQERVVTESCFLQKGINFYRTEDFTWADPNAAHEKYSNYFCLGKDILEDSEHFRKVFDMLSNGQAFTQPIPCEYNQKGKSYSFDFPAWMSSSGYYSVAEYFVAFFEQMITIHYFTRNDGSMPDDPTYLNKLMSEKKDLISFVKKEFGTDSEKLCDTLEIADLIEAVKSDPRVSEIIKSKDRNQELITFDGILYNNFVFYTNSLLTTIELEKRIKHFFSCFKNAEEIIDCLMFTNLEGIFTYDDFLMKRMHESLLDLYARKSANDLMNDIYEKADKKKKKKAKKKLKPCDDDKSCFAFIKKVKKETKEFKRGEFMGDIMMVKSGTTDQDDMKATVKDVIDNLLTQVSQEVVSIQSDSSEETATIGPKASFDEKETAASSPNHSDNNSPQQKRKKQNNYRLYDFKVKETKDIKSSRKHNSVLITPTEIIKNERKQSTNVESSTKPLSLDKVYTSVSKSSDTTPLKSNATTSFQININSQFNIKNQPNFKKHQSFPPQFPNNDFYQKHNYHNGFRFYYDLPPMNNFYYFNNGHNNINELFNFKFQKYIINYTEGVDNNLNSLKEIKDEIISELIELVKKSLSKLIN